MGGGPVTDLAVILLRGDVEDMMPLVIHRPVRPEQVSEADCLRKLTSITLCKPGHSTDLSNLAKSRQTTTLY